jgi:hypothetical protein
MQINVALQDGFDGDTVFIRVDGAEAYRGEQVTTRTQISHAADMQIDVPDGPFTLEVDVPTRGVRETFQLDRHAHPNVALSLLDGELVAVYPERLGFA